MTTELTGVIPRMPFDYASRCVQRSILDVYRKSYWSWLTFEANWTTPAWVQTGTVNVTQGSNTVQFDPLSATPAINAIGTQPSPVTKRQFRIGVGTIYNIWGWSAPAGTVDTSGTAVTWVSGDTFNPDGSQDGLEIAIGGTAYTIDTVSSATALTLTTSAGSQSGAAFQVGGVATLDRLYQESTATDSAYAILQCYYASPVQDFRGWASIRDMLNYNDLFFNKDRAWGDTIDPQRTFYYIPTNVWFFQNDLNPNSSTYGWPLFEIWGAPTYQLTYQLWGYRSGYKVTNGMEVPLVGPGCSLDSTSNPSASLPQGIGEDVVMAKARKYAYEWAEANRNKMEGGQNFVTLKRDSDVDYNKLFRDYRKQDRALYDAFHVHFRRSRAFPGVEPAYNAIAGVASPGA